MSDALIEKVARAIIDAEMPMRLASHAIGMEDARDLARAAIAAIEETHIVVARPRPDSLTQADVDRASEKIFERAVELVEGTGTHAVVPVVPTEEMFNAMFGETPFVMHHPARLACYRDMLAARPKVTP